MKKSFLLFSFFLTTFIGFSNGIIIVNAEQGTTLKMTNSEINVDVNNQVGLVVSSQRFFNDTGDSFLISYGFPMPNTASATQLRWRINNGDWSYAIFEAGQQDPPVGGGNSVHPDIVQYLGDTPLYFNFDNPIQNEDIIEVEISYVQLLSYKFGVVTFNYPSDYSLIQTSIIEENQSIDFQLYSDRTIDFLAIDNYVASITNDGNLASLIYSETGTTTLDNIVITYQLASDELGVISFSTLLEEQTCDEYGNGFLGLIIEPESNVNTEVIEKVFTLIIDKSGSMGTLKMEQAKEAATFIVNNLNQDDYFNLISFDSNINSFKPDHVIYNTTNQIDALNFISNISSGGMTNISDALTEAIYQFGATDPNKANMIVFFTDGQATAGTTSTQGILDNVEAAISANETSIFLHTFGIGNNVNVQLLTLLALENQGVSTFIGDDEIEAAISDFYLTIRNPVLLNTEIQFTPNIVSQTYPDPLPNLYKGQQLILTGRYDTPQLVTVELSGNAFNTNVNYSYDVDLADIAIENLAFLPKLWAKAKIEYLQYLFYSLPIGSQEANDTQALIEEISICYQVLSDFTIFNTGGGATGIEDVLSDHEEFKIIFHPNPFKEKTVAYIDLLYTQPIIISIYDVNGKLVYLVNYDGEAGSNLISWDGTNFENKSVESGVYFYRVETNSKSYFGKLIKI